MQSTVNSASHSQHSQSMLPSTPQSPPQQPTTLSPYSTQGYMTPPVQIRYGIPPTPSAPMRRRLTFTDILVNDMDNMELNDMEIED